MATSNPFRVGLDETLGVAPCSVVIFGATGDLTHRKLVPALYNLAVDSLLPAHFSIVGAARRPLKSEDFRDQLKASVSENSRRKPLDKRTWDELASHTHYVHCPFDDPEGFKRLRAKLEEIDRQAGQRSNRVFYMATSPDYFEAISERMHAEGLLAEQSREGEFPRVVFEKPFGHDLESALELNKSITSFMDESQIYRIDHYLGKETVQNLMVFRFANGIFEPIWNHKYIAHVEISVCEELGVGSRAGYFDTSGILRDIVQNHVFQLLSLVALEPPVAFEPDAVRDEKVKVLRSIRRLSEDEVSDKVVRGRYQQGYVSGEKVQGYLGEEGVSPQSTTETYVALELNIDNWRWSGVPFFLRAGKRLAKRVTEVSIHFRGVPHTLFSDADVRLLPQNTLSFQIQPEEGIAMSISSKPPGPGLRVQPVKMDFQYGTSFGESAPEAYERLLLDAMRGDPTLFTRADEIEQAWAILEPVFNRWSRSEHEATPIYGYEAGSWGPSRADEIMAARTGKSWRRL